MGPCPAIAMRCNTAQRPPAGRVTSPPSATVPRTSGPWAARPPAALPARSAASAGPRRLRREFAEVVRVEVLQVGLERLGIERRRAAGAALPERLRGLHGGVLQQLVAGEDRCLEPEGEGDGVGG